MKVSSIKYNIKARNLSSALPEYDSFDTYIKMIKQYKKLTRKEEVALAKKIKNGGLEAQKARETLTTSNLSLVVYAAKIKAQKSKLSLIDLIQEGNIGLYRATENYNGETAFITYAMSYIIGKMVRAEKNQVRLIRLPEYISEIIANIKKAEESLYQKYTRDPKPEEIAQELNITENKVKFIQNCSKKIESIDEKLHDESDSIVVKDIIKDTNPLQIYKEVQREELKEALFDILKTFSKKSRDVVVKYFGLDGSAPCSITEIAKQRGTSRAATHGVLKRALKRLRNVGAKSLREFLQQED